MTRQGKTELWNLRRKVLWCALPGIFLALAAFLLSAEEAPTNDRLLSALRKRSSNHRFERRWVGSMGETVIIERMSFDLPPSQIKKVLRDFARSHGLKMIRSVPNALDVAQSPAAVPGEVKQVTFIYGVSLTLPEGEYPPLPCRNLTGSLEVICERNVGTRTLDWLKGLSR